MDTFGNLNMPHEDFVIYISSLEIIFQQNFELLAVKNNIVKSFLELSKSVKFIHLCEHFPHNYLLKLFFRVRLYYTLKFVNKNFRNANKTKILIWRNQ